MTGHEGTIPISLARNLTAEDQERLLESLKTEK